MSSEDQNRCWPGYEPVPGKKPNSQGSCRPKAESKSTPSEKQFKAKRKRQLDKWQKEHPGSPRKAAQHISGPNGESSSPPKAAKKSPKKAAAKKTAVKKTTGKKAPAKKATAKRSSRKQAA